MTKEEHLNHAFRFSLSKDLLEYQKTLIKDAMESYSKEQNSALQAVNNEMEALLRDCAKYFETTESGGYNSENSEPETDSVYYKIINLLKIIK